MTDYEKLIAMLKAAQITFQIRTNPVSIIVGDPDADAAYTILTFNLRGGLLTIDAYQGWGE